MKNFASQVLRSPYLWGMAFYIAGRALVSEGVEAYASTGLTQLAAAFLVALLWRPLERANRRTACAWIIAFVGAVLIAWAFARPGMQVTTFLGLCCVAIVSIIWCEAYARCGIAEGGAALALSYMIGLAVFTAIRVLPAGMQAGLAVAMPVMSVACLAAAQLYRDVIDRRAKEPIASVSLAPIFPFTAVPWWAVSVASALAFATGAVRMHTTPAVDMLAAGVAGVLMLAVIALSARRFSIFHVLRIAFLVMMIGPLAGVVLGSQSIISQVAVNVGYAFAMMLMMLFCCDRAHRFGAPILFSYAVSRVVSGVSFMLGTAAGGWVTSLSSEMGGSLLYVIPLVAIAVEAVFWLSSDAVKETGDTRELGQSEEEPETADEGVLPAHNASADASELLRGILEKRCGELATEYCLSDRELEVLVLLAWGKSMRGIEESLVVSNNTVKTHVRHIYSKLGIHSRGELDILIGVER